jgi:threonine synthase
VRTLFADELSRAGQFSLSAAELARIAEFGFVSGTSSHADRLAHIANTWNTFGVMIDPHTADGLKVARAHTQAGVPMLVLETALPAKFEATILEATGQPAPRPAGLEGIEALPKRFTVMPADAQQVKAFVHAHAPAH